MALHDGGKARVNRRATLLRACALAGLGAQPVLAMPGHNAQSELLSAEVLSERGPVQPIVQAQSASVAGIRGKLVTGNSGTFDVAVPAALAAESAVLPAGPASAAVAERVLVTNDAPPAAEIAYVERGAIVLASAAKSPLATTLASATDTNLVNFKGSTAGCFGAGCTPSASATTGGLTFAGGSFDVSSPGSGFLAIGGSQNNFGTVSLSGASFSYTGTPFSLVVNFTSPGAASGTFSVNLLGSVSGENSGGVLFTFNSTQSFTLPNGTFTLSFANVAISGSGSNLPFTGLISSDLQAPPKPVVPRDEVVLSLDTRPASAGKDINTVLDLSQLTPTDVSAPIDAGVTSGADPSEWDPIDVQEESTQSCKDASAAGADANGAAICHAEKK